MRIKPLILLLLISLPGIARGQTASNQVLRWKAVEGAAEYRIEIRSDDALVIDTKTPDSFLNLLLAPGAYEFRVTVINKFSKAVYTSPWNPLTVEVQLSPRILSTEPTRVYETPSGALDLYAEAVQISEKAVWTLEGPGKTEIPLTGAVQPGNRYRLSGKGDPLAPGFYALTVENPDGQNFRLSRALEILPKPQLRISGIIPKTLDSGAVYPELILQGADFSEEIQFRFEGPGTIEVLGIRKISPSRAVISVSLQSAPEGNYTVKAIHPPSGETESPALDIEVTPRRAVEGPISRGDTRERAVEEGILPGERRSALLVHLKGTFPLGDDRTNADSDGQNQDEDGSSLNPAFVNISLLWHIDFLNTAAMKNPGLVRTGFELGLGTQTHKHKNNLYQMTALYADLGLYARIPFNSWFSLGFRIDNGFSTLFITIPDRESELIQTLPGYHVKPGVFFDFLIAKKALIDLGLQYEGLFFPENHYHMISFHIGAGYAF